jgi:hypothetical protein
MSCDVALGSQVVICQPVTLVMSEIALGEPHYVSEGNHVSQGSGKSDVLGASKAKTDNMHRPRGGRVSGQVPGASALGARNGPIVYGQRSGSLTRREECEVECR